MVSEHKRGSDGVTSLCLLMVDVVVLVRTRRYAAVRESPAPVRTLLLPVSRSACASGDEICPSVPVQWMVTGQSGRSGRNAHAPVVRATEPGCGPAVTPQLSTEADFVKGKQWR